MIKYIICLIAELACMVSACAQTLVHTLQATPSQPPSTIAAVQAASTSQFINSIGVACHFDYYWTPYNNFPEVEALLLQSGIPNIRDGGTDPVAVSSFRALHDAGIDVTWVMDPIDGVAPTSTYWTASPHYLLPSFLKNVLGTSTISAIEISNEIDIFYAGKKWHPQDPNYLSSDPSASNYWGKYIQSLVQDTSAVVRQDPALASIPLIGTSFGGTWAGVPAGAFYNFVDEGAIHPYMYRGNAAVTNASAYEGVSQYLVQSTEPSVLIDEYPTAITNFDYPYQSGNRQEPLIATETGYFTGRAAYSIDELTQAKYVPRMFAEFFRHSIAKAFMYEFVDEGVDGGMENSFGLIRADLTPKPAYAALQSMIALLVDSGGAFSPGTLTYGFVASPNQAYTRLQYAHDLLLQKSDGDFYLVFWHEISDADRVDSYGGPVTGTDPEVSPQTLPVEITLPSNIVKATLYTYDTNWKLQPTPVNITANRMLVQASDQMGVLRLQTASTAMPVPTTNTPVTTTTTLMASASQIMQGQSLSLSAAVVPASGSTIPSGTVSFYAGQTQIGTAALAGGKATLSVTLGLSAGTYNLTATYAGDSADDASTSLPVVIAISPIAVATTTALMLGPQQLMAGQMMVLQVSVSTTVPGNLPSGTATLYLDGASIGTLMIAGGMGTFSVQAPQAGTHTAWAVFAAQGDYLSSRSASDSFTIQSDTPGQPSGSFTVALSTGSLSLSTPQAEPASLQVAVAASGGYTGSIQFSCSGLPAGISSTFSPARVTVNGTKATSTLTLSGQILQTSNSQMRLHLEEGLLIPWATLGLWIAALRRRHLGGKQTFFLALALLAPLMCVSGCGLTINNLTRPYIITVTAVDQNQMTEATTFTLDVTQPAMTF